MPRKPFILCLTVAISAAAAAHGQSLTLDDPASPIRATFNTANGRLAVTMKSTGTQWKNPDSGGGDALTVSNSLQLDPLHITANATTSAGYAITLSLALAPVTGDLSITIGGDPNLSIPNKIKYPYAFHKSDGSGYAVVPVMGGYVVPTTSTTWTLPSNHSRMEWLGGTDGNWNEGWICIADPAADMFFVKQTAIITGASGGGSRLSMVFEWRGTNSAPAGGADRLTYNRTSTLRFFPSGGYVAQAKHFREFAISKGWYRSLIDKISANPDVAKLIGAPVIYLWGDGRSQTMLDALQNAGIQKALIQLSINHVDQNNTFPNQQFANNSGWSTNIKNRGWIPGIYDIYVRYNSPQTTPPLNGFSYLWPTIANPMWIYINQDSSLSALDICAQRAGPFARDTRLPAHISQFGLDAFFFDVTCAVEPREDFDATNGHHASRTQDIANRAALLGAASIDHNKMAGAEQAKSWAVPNLHWTEGMFRLGATGTATGYGSFNNNAYPQILTDVTDPGATNLAGILSTGFQAPLWDLVYHDAILSTQHWHLAHNKLLYCWDQADRAAIIRGQPPLLNLTYNAAVGTVGRAVAGATDARDGRFWDTRWTNPNVSARVMQTCNTVCLWHQQIGLMPMFDHRYLVADQSVQMSEFSDNNGLSGRGVVVNFGRYDGSFGVTGSPWSGMIRGTPINVSAGAFQFYSWLCPADINGDSQVDFNDYLDFVDALSNASPASDFNHDGVIDFNDYLDFVDALSAGC